MIRQMVDASDASVSDYHYSHRKRIFDLFVVLLLSIPAALIVLLVAPLVIVDGGKLFFRQKRVGRDGQEFDCIKIRSMANNAEELLRKLIESDPEFRSEWEEKQKVVRDPRVTRIGRIIRLTSIDELPQLLNVLKGEMSIVGPRPVTKAELERYGECRGAYLALRPGITGLWQVSGRSNTTYEERVALDYEYSGGATLSGDVRIVLSTIKVVFGLKGAF